ncbi:DUF3892 domain-containing protein [Ethanoligenens harbinense]|uniref:DUF3892 domain-containing protein n=1 Tax=Ethanoligenens harbinense (strain DSM 18485 / JCM 12961 / CGMCC 1.5033 / YUAN-3) TaxID=663278 RepID=E6U8P3_ETHHY|nr:DUF3892 domain-containing protein [Ethanoligenens harbinense]ADU26034.1 hypothetical protein Ethha_0449 [Ethanoligenens harbinense YUAN-3]AVQ97325.1 DUF3892 domain-containing protein [Ethanoligenens harbinense YUAN-3]AYF39989.1 DUF3892 domain-containing protein [Ethanoligenens harbinense]AYF42816.1 DUF3892 domain-containing protein [Ethanoligenens harbinense]QCN93569.1 DUF3892 domain-containing protein [Ethanoligenens harbinense]
MQATKIRMKPGRSSSDELTEIDSIYLTGCQQVGYYKKEDIHNYLIGRPGNIQVNIYPYPNIVPATSSRGEKYVRSTPDSSLKDNLLNLPRT